MANQAKYLTASEAAKHLACSTSYLAKGRVTGDGPRFIKLGKAVRYRVVDLNKWAAARAHKATAEYAR